MITVSEARFKLMNSSGLLASVLHSPGKGRKWAMFPTKTKFQIAKGRPTQLLSPHEISNQGRWDCRVNCVGQQLCSLRTIFPNPAKATHSSCNPRGCPSSLLIESNCKYCVCLHWNSLCLGSSPYLACLMAPSKVLKRAPHSSTTQWKCTL